MAFTTARGDPQRPELGGLHPIRENVAWKCYARPRPVWRATTRFSELCIGMKFLGSKPIVLV